MSIILNLFIKLKHFVARRYPRLFNRLLRHKSIVKFFMSGPVAGIVDLLVLYLLHGLLNVSVVLATTIAYIFSFWVSFYLQKFWTFCNYNKKRVYHQLVMYFMLAFANLSLNGYLMHVSVNRYHVWYILAQLGVSFAIGLESFVIYKFVIFRKRHDDFC